MGKKDRSRAGRASRGVDSVLALLVVLDGGPWARAVAGGPPCSGGEAVDP